jgi:chemotaxis protein methyltransferase CheR
MVQFRPFNLLSDFSHLGVFDVVFCRNVLIYFDQATKVGVLERLARINEPDGYLVLGAAETVVGLTEVFKPIADRRGLYMPNAAAKAAVTGFSARKPAAVAAIR